MQVLRPHDLSNWASWIWDNNTLGACIIETSTQLPLIQDTANCCGFFPVVKGLQEKGGAMALRILWDGGLPAAIPYISRLVVPSCRTSTLSFPTAIPSRRGSFSVRGLSCRLLPIVLKLMRHAYHLGGIAYLMVILRTAAIYYQTWMLVD